MSMTSGEWPYNLVKDEKGLIASITRRSDGAKVPLDPTDREYCKFVTWAATQTEPVAEGIEGLPANATCLGHEDDVVEYFRQRALVLSVTDRFGRKEIDVGFDDPIRRPGISIGHAEGRVENSENPISFCRLCRSAELSGTEDGDGTKGLAPVVLPQVIIPETLRGTLSEKLKEDDSQVRCISSLPVEKTFVYVDVSEFSRHLVGQQLLIINTLIELVGDPRWWKVYDHPDIRDAFEDREASLCIGDGYIFVFKESRHAVRFAGYLAALIEGLIAHERILEFHFRMSVHTGEVYRFWDRWGKGPGDGRWNYVGKGITVGERVLIAMGKEKDDVVYVSAETRQELLSVREPISYLAIPLFLQNRGRQADKHEEMRRVFEMDHTARFSEAVRQAIEIRKANP
jgi:hypothetical protein